ncbi:hypothetical protein LIER_08199 [Lithospermum erythrorhizon]|uniref:Uncharacterized protein n=1 Tax=Lithospermum erythrorhizon TaxID=34254 RepID=A0AAV3PBB5_LITER
METRGCRHLHFISAIKKGSVTKVPNVNSCGKPALRFKSLKDVYKSEDAVRMSSNSAVEQIKVKTEALCPPKVDRTLRKEDFGFSECVSHGSSDDMPDDSTMTLHQIREIWRRKKQKLSSGRHSANRVYDNLQSQEDEFDLKEPLIHWKQKLSQKSPNRKRKCSSGRTVRSDRALSVKLEPLLDSEGFGFANRDLMSLVCVKSENPESESFEVPSSIAFVDVVEPNFDTDFSDGVLEEHVYNNQELVLYGDGYQDYFPDSSEDIEVDGCDSFQQVLCIEECQSCVLNEVCYDHLDPILLLEASDEDIVYASDEMTSCQPCVVSSAPDSNDKSDSIFSRSTPEIVTSHKDQICHISGSLNNSHLLNDTSGQSSSSPGVQPHDISVDTELEIINHLAPVTQTESFSLQQSVSSLNFHACSDHDDESDSMNYETAERDKNQACCSTDAARDCWSPGNDFPSNLPPTSEKQPPEMVNIDSSSSKTENSLDDYTLSAPVLKIPGRLTRKIIPPTSQERLCLAMNCEELNDDCDEYKCKEKLFLEKTESSPPIARSNIETAKRAENDAKPEQLNQRKNFISSSHIVQKARSEKRGSPPKHNLEQPCYSRSLPSINTGCTSVKSCSKGAIAFSQRQMHDADSLAGKLLNELKSMKEIIEQKLLLNSCRNLSSRKDADEVVAAIKTATRVEENARRSLSVMSRNCNRFCKIMSLTQDGPSTPEIIIPRERRKIVFADEAGERLCHIKFFENGLTSTEPLPPKMDNQNVNALPKEIINI